MKIIYDIYTDGACSGNPGYGAWAFIVTNGTEKLYSLSGGEQYTTNNRMELQAIVKALAIIEKKIVKDKKKYKDACHVVRIMSDSAYCVNAINKRWIKKWLGNDWKTSKNQNVINRDLWEKVNEYDKKIDFQLIKVEGHSGNSFNEMCDRIAKEEIQKIKK